MYSASFQTLSAVSLPFPRWVAPRSSCLHSFLRSFDIIHILIYHVPPSPPLSTYNSPRIVRSFLFSFFFSFFPPLFPFLWKEYPLSSTLATLVYASSPRESLCFYLFTIATNNGYHTSLWDWRERDSGAWFSVDVVFLVCGR